jgi:WRKY DNA -binding domain
MTGAMCCPLKPRQRAATLTTTCIGVKESAGLQTLCSRTWIQRFIRRVPPLDTDEAIVQRCCVCRWKMSGNKSLSAGNTAYEKHYFQCSTHAADGSACPARMYAQGTSNNSVEITYCGRHIHAPPGNRFCHWSVGHLSCDDPSVPAQQQHEQ